MTAAFEPTEEQRRTVRAMSGYGIPQEDIAILLDVDPKTLRKHFRRELSRGSVEATAKVAQTLFHMATVEKNVGAAIFWMKARAGWREKHEVVVSPKMPLSELSDEELNRLVHEGLKDLAEERQDVAAELRDRQIEHDPQEG